MTQALWLKKIWKGRSKGISSVIGTIFLIIVFFAISTNIFIWAISQNAIYNEAVRTRNQLEVDRLNEKVKAFNANYTVYVDSKVLTSVELQNLGSLSAQLSNFWLSDVDIGNYNFSGPLNINLQAGATLTYAINVTLAGSNSSHTFNSWFVTGRGNVVPAETAPPPESEHLPISATGYFSLDWFYLKYTARYHTTPMDAAVVSKSYRYVAFYINVTNNGDEAMTVKSTSLIMLLIEWQEPLFYIVRSASYPVGGGTPTITAYNDGNPIIIGSHQSQILTFASKPSGVTTWSWGGSLPDCLSHDTPEGGIVMTALVYTMVSQPTITYAQSLSFRALVLGY